MTRELYIGDNLPVLQGLNSETVDFVYLDPPFNSQRSYTAPIASKAAGQRFDDTWRWDSLNTAWLGEIDDRNPALGKVVDAARAANGNGTAAYLTMMGIRLLELERVLKSGGAIFLHCDDTASHYLKACMDATFGADAFRNDIVWQRTKGRSDAASRFARVKDNILFYAKPGGGGARISGMRPCSRMTQGTSLGLTGIRTSVAGTAWRTSPRQRTEGQKCRAPSRGEEEIQRRKGDAGTRRQVA